MPVTIRDIAAADSYVGSPQLGGSIDGVINIDTRPLDQLNAYTFSYNKTLFEQKQKDLEAQAAEVADFASYDLTNAIPKYAKQIRDEYDEVYKYLQDNPTAIDYKTNPKGWMERKRKINSLKNNIRDGASQEIINKAFQDAIDKETRPEVIASLEKQRREQIENNDIKTPIKFQQYDAEKIALPTVPKRIFDVIRKDEKGDMIADRKYEIPDQKFINEQAAVIGLGMEKELLNQNSSEFLALPKDVQDLRRTEYERRKGTGRLAEVEDAKMLTEILQNTDYRNTENKIDETKVLGVPIVGGSLQAIIDYNKTMDDEVAKINAGYYSDNLGVLKFGVNGLNINDYKKIDYSDGKVDATDLLKVKMRASAPTTTYNTEAKELNNSIQRGQLAKDWYVATTGRINATKSSESDGSYSTNDLSAADGVLREISDIINKGDVPSNQVNVTDLSGNKKKVFVIGDPTILQKFGDIDNTGLVTNIPDEARYNPKTNEIDLVYFSKKGNAVEKNATGGNWIRDQKTLNARTWANMVSQRTFSGQDRGNVNEIVQAVITKNGGDLYKVAKLIEGKAATDNAPNNPSTTSGTVKVQGVNGRVYTVPASDVNEVLKANKGAKIIQ